MLSVSALCLGLEVNDSQSSYAKSNAQYSWTPAIILQAFAYAAIMLYGSPFQGTSAPPFGCNRANTTSPIHCCTGFSLPYTAFARCYSQHPKNPCEQRSAKQKLRCWFLFLPVLRCFNSRRVPSFRTYSGTLGSKTACVSPRIIAACHALRRQLSLVIP